MTLRLNGSSSGYTEIDAPAVAGNNNLKLPGGNGSDGNILGTDGAGNLSWVNGRMVLGTSQASTSGTFVDFTGIPSWVKRVTVMFSGVSVSGTSKPIVRLGTSGGLQTSSYNSGAAGNGTAANENAGFPLCAGDPGAANQYAGSMVLINLSGNVWVASGSIGRIENLQAYAIGGTVTLSGTLTQLRITTVNGTDTFDAGSINILYEG